MVHVVDEDHNELNMRETVESRYYYSFFPEDPAARPTPWGMLIGGLRWEHDDPVRGHRPVTG